mmetsp:Transcript_34884/g.84289  ORF Transcript_34884/g.84289 Transcript_34884/m.84289 type:complete len:82 (-) Transcript_34884:824-1069(-)
MPSPPPPKDELPLAPISLLSPKEGVPTSPFPLPILLLLQSFSTIFLSVESSKKRTMILYQAIIRLSFYVTFVTVTAFLISL